MERVFGTERGILHHTTSTPIHTRLPFKYNAQACLSLKSCPFSQDVGPSIRLVRHVGAFTFHFAIALGFTALQQSHCDIALGYTFLIVGSVGESPRQPLI